MCCLDSRTEGPASFPVVQEGSVGCRDRTLAATVVLEREASGNAGYLSAFYIRRKDTNSWHGDSFWRTGEVSAPDELAGSRGLSNTVQKVPAWIAQAWKTTANIPEESYVRVVPKGEEWSTHAQTMLSQALRQQVIEHEIPEVVVSELAAALSAAQLSRSLLSDYGVCILGSSVDDNFLGDRERHTRVQRRSRNTSFE